MGDSQYMAGDEITIADYSIVATVSSIEVFTNFITIIFPSKMIYWFYNIFFSQACGYDLSRYSKVKDWFERCKKEMIDYEEVNQKGADILGALVKSKIKN